MTARDDHSSMVNFAPGVVVAVDLGGTHLRAAVVDQNGEVEFRLKHETLRTEDASKIVEALVNAVHECERRHSENGTDFKAVSVVVPGTVNLEQGTVVKTPNVPCLDGFPLVAALNSDLKQTVLLENDANAAALGELWLGAGRGKSSIICVTLGTGVGGGIVLDGNLWRGVDGSAGEIGHMSVDPFGSVACGCGNHGCLEVYASATAIVRMANEKGLQHDSLLSHREDLTAKAVYAAGLAGDELALDVFERMGAYLGIGLANLINILNPEMIVIGGGVASGWTLFEKHMQREVAKRTFALRSNGVKIVPAECGDDAGLLGAAWLAFTAH